MPAARKRIARHWKRRLEKETGVKGINVGVYGNREKYREKCERDNIFFSEAIDNPGYGEAIALNYFGGTRYVTFLSPVLKGRKLKQGAAHEMGHTVYAEAQQKYYGIPWSKLNKAIEEGHAISAQLEGFLSAKGETKENLRKLFKHKHLELDGKKPPLYYQQGIQLANLILQAAPYNPKKRSEIRREIARRKFKSVEECMQFVKDNFMKRKAVKK